MTCLASVTSPSQCWADLDLEIFSFIKSILIPTRHRRHRSVSQTGIGELVRTSIVLSIAVESGIGFEDAMSTPTRAIPAQLGFLAIYNPSLGTTDETIEDQIVYYSTPGLQERKTKNPKAKKGDLDDAAREENNEQLRQIGLAQGMVEFGRSFSDGRAVDTVETEKSRIILHELESGWWILAVRETPRTPLVDIQTLLILCFAVDQFNSPASYSKDRHHWERKGL